MREILDKLLNSKHIGLKTYDSILSEKNSGERFKKFERTIFRFDTNGFKGFLDAWERTCKFCKFFFYFFVFIYKFDFTTLYVLLLNIALTI